MGISVCAFRMGLSVCPPETSGMFRKGARGADLSFMANLSARTGCIPVGLRIISRIRHIFSDL
ncbi:hypothetical protein B4135_0496 [Caldibacillus debilis]|uniref:Uncharacterized protein n=1 Tax=Caldibacillus debilis TaxID=301148 RepID=A0A150L943_9BACI|nr:hypothetical protein B4135_0496 [Caldibacillus debilis]